MGFVQCTELHYVFELPPHFKLLTVKIIASFFSSEFICAVNLAVQLGKGEGKTIPLKASTGPAGSRRLGLPDFKKVNT